MTPQEKAAAYDKAIERARRKIEDYKNRGLENYIAYAKENIDYIFPELKESEGENMKESLITFFRKYPYSIGDAGINPLDAIAWLEKQGERKPADKVEPNFKVGEWIIFDENPNSVYQVEKIQGLRYYLRHYLGGTLSVHFDNELIRPWTIEDAKDGDVITWDDTTCVVLFKDIKNSKCFISYCFANTISFEMGTSHYIKGCHPATKEQRDTLMKAMADAGYTFDFDKKELKKIENEIEIPFGTKDSELQEATYYIPKGFHAEIDDDKVVIKKGEKPTEWSEEDENLFNRCIINIQMVDSDDTLKIWLKSLKDRVQPQPKQEWSEKDYNFIKELCDLLASISKDGYVGKYYTVDLVEKLKSLRPRNRWEPSEGQMKSLRWVIEYGNTTQTETLKGIYEQLKKLREG